MPECFRVDQLIDLTDPAEGVGLHMALHVDKSFSGAELDLFINTLHMTVPAIQNTSEFKRSEEENPMGATIVYEWLGNDKQPLDTMPFTLTENSDGSFVFDWSIPPLENFSEQSDSDSIILGIGVVLPKNVDFANTMNVQGQAVIWELTKAALAEGVRLRAITE